MRVETMKDLDKLSIEQIIRLPFFFSLRVTKPNLARLETAIYWEIIFKCNKVDSEGNWKLLDYESETEYFVRYKLVEPQPAPRDTIVKILKDAGILFAERGKVLEINRQNLPGAVLRRVLEQGILAVHIQEEVILLTLG